MEEKTYYKHEEVKLGLDNFKNITIDKMLECIDNEDNLKFQSLFPVYKEIKECEHILQGFHTYCSEIERYAQKIKIEDRFSNYN